MKNLCLILGCLIFCFTIGCATPGQKLIDLNYSGAQESSLSGKVGITLLTDKRKDIQKGYVGYRVLNDKSRETFFVRDLDLPKVLTVITALYLDSHGFTTQTIDKWERSPDGVSKTRKDLAYVIDGDINTFECKAVKSGTITKMTLKIDLTLFVGNKKTGALKTIPVALNLERTELSFSEKKLETFINTALHDLLIKALSF
ncbi:MAG: hypothetical protein GY729_20205 [Desulfobacteraceae bacterium]|nr:hypothetical protein [Desulfobacteraceae bacterium]